jgi:alkylated DNA repair dioxygenase AlkB
VTVLKHAYPAQLRLFGGGGEPTLNTAFTGRRRVQLDAATWLEHCPGWLTCNERLMESLANAATWEQRKRWMYTQHLEEPRLTAEYPTLSQAPVPLLRQIGRVLSDHYGVTYDSAWLNLYRDNNDSTAWHGDRSSCQRAECIVPVLSLGETRRFLIRPREGGRSTVFIAEGGDLIVMGGRCQRDWVHCVPKETPRAGARISVNFGSSFQATPE